MQTAGLNILWIIFEVIKFYAYFSDLVSHESNCVAWDFVWEMSALNTIDAWCHQNRRWCLTTRIDGFLCFIQKLLRSGKLNYGFYEFNSVEFMSDGNVCGFIIIHFICRNNNKHEKSAISDGSVKEKNMASCGWFGTKLFVFLRVSSVMVISTRTTAEQVPNEIEKTMSYNSRSFWFALGGADNDNC